jgi:hypothetical protein
MSVLQEQKTDHNPLEEDAWRKNDEMYAYWLVLQFLLFYRLFNGALQPLFAQMMASLDA